jgi:TetR/AcrR family transcriptional regulator, cholesterol catabolism regulator
MPLPPTDDSNLDASRRERRKLDVTRRIRRAALELFHEKGYDATTVEEIAERADVAKGTFFNHFPRKDALLLALGEEVLDRIEEQLGPVAAWEGAVDHQVLRFFLAISELAGRDRDLTRVMLIENMRNCWMQADPDPVELRFQEALRTILARAAERGELRPHVQIGAAVKLLEALHLSTVVDWLRTENTTTSLSEALTLRLDLVCHGICNGTSAGHHA